MDGLDSMPAYAVYKLQSKSMEDSVQGGLETVSRSAGMASPADLTSDKSCTETASKKSSSVESPLQIEEKTLNIQNSETAAGPGVSSWSSLPLESETGGVDGEVVNIGTAGVFVSSRKKQKICHALSEAIKKKKKKQKKRMLLRSSANGMRIKKGRYKTRDPKGMDSEDLQQNEGQISVKEELEEQQHSEEDQQTSITDELEYEPFKNAFDQDSYSDSRTAARELFSMLIKPLDVDLFFSESWEKRPVLLRRHQDQYNDGWFSTQELDSILQEDLTLNMTKSKNYLEFTKNIDVTTYEDGVRKTHNLDGRATAPAVWDFYKNGCSVRVLNPQTYSKGVWLLTSTLQELFGSCMGANVYLTPPGSQGFAPHYDDIEAFVMQLEGKKLWKIYKERNEKDMLPRYSSCTSTEFLHFSALVHLFCHSVNSVSPMPLHLRHCTSHRTPQTNLTEEDLSEPSLEIVLEPGDLLYFPRGTIHQASTLGEQHSLHITLSTFQKNSWADLIEKLLPAALEVAVNEDEEFRCGLPLDYLQYMGMMFSDSYDSRRDEFFAKVSSLFAKLSNHLPIDAAVDQLGSDFMHGCLPPCITPAEKSRTSIVAGDKWGCGRLVHGVELEGSTKVKLVRYGAVRLVVEKDGVLLFTTATNSRLNAARDKCGVYIDSNEASGIDYLLQSYPDYVAIKTIPLKGASVEDKVDFSYTLFLQGVLMVETGS